MIFTFKDFINYNNPCFICNSLTSLSLNINGYTFYPSLEKNDKNKQILHCILKISYKTYLDINIDIKNNKYYCLSNINFLNNYLKDARIMTSLYCDNCMSFVKSDVLKFNYEKSYVEPIIINNEVYTYIDKKKYIITLNDIDSNISISDYVNTSKIKIPKFKRPNNKEILFKKIKTYLTYL
tara:strand:- start:5443 stop:5985 length:543 start_codon:yes stop_codon:yes gene_type:complete